MKKQIQDYAEIVDDYDEIVNNVENILRKFHLDACYDFHLMAEQVVGSVLAKKINHEKINHPFVDRRRRNSLHNR